MRSDLDNHNDEYSLNKITFDFAILHQIVPESAGKHRRKRKKDKETIVVKEKQCSRRTNSED